MYLIFYIINSVQFTAFNNVEMETSINRKGKGILLMETSSYIVEKKIQFL